MAEPQEMEQLQLFDVEPSPHDPVPSQCPAESSPPSPASTMPDGAPPAPSIEPRAINDPDFFGGSDLEASLAHYLATGDDIYVLEWLSDNDEEYARMEDECAEHDTREYPTAQDKRIVATLLDELDAYRIAFIERYLYGNEPAKPNE